MRSVLLDLNSTLGVLVKRLLLSMMCLSLTACGSMSKAQITQPSIVVISSKENVQSIGLATMSERLASKTLTVNSNPAYGGASKKYQGFDLLQFLKEADPDLDLSAPFWLEVTTLDGWKAPAYSSEILISGKALLAVRELKETLTSPISDDGLWSIVVTPKKTFYPGPFYIVWNDSGKNPDVMPLQVASIRISLSKPKR